MAFPTRFLDELRSRVSLATVIGRTVKLTRKGREHSGLCPFHNEKTPSFTVAEEKGWFHCFGCGAHGDVIDFIMRTQHASFPEACEMLAQEAGLELPSDTPEERAKSVQRATMLEALEAACVFYQQQLQTAGGKQALTYLLGRGVNEESVTRFRLGWAPDARNSLRKALPADRFPDQLLVDVGLLHMGENGPDFDFFRGRIIFPITDARGRVIAFGARTLTDQQPKYLNSPETPLFKKGTNLYGYALARATVSEQQPAIVVEGYMDVIALHQHGFTGAMAPLGTALTEEQIEALWKLSPEPVLCLDGDTAGIRARHKAADRALPMVKSGYSLRFAELPAGQDPDEILAGGGSAAMTAALASAIPLFEQIWQMATKDRALDTPEQLASLQMDLAGLADVITDPILKVQYQRAFHRKLVDAGVVDSQPVAQPAAVSQSPVEKKKRFQTTDPVALLMPPAEFSADQLPAAFLAHQLGIDVDQVVMPDTPTAGWTEMAYFDPPSGQEPRPTLLGDYPCAIFATADSSGQRHGLRIYVAPDGNGYADLGQGREGIPRSAVKLAKKRVGERVAGFGVVWGRQATAKHFVLCAGVDSGAAIAYALKDRLSTDWAVIACMDSDSMDAWVPPAHAEMVVVACDRDEDKSKAGRRFRRGELAGKRFAGRHAAVIEIRLIVAGQQGESLTWQGMFVRDGVIAVSNAVLQLATPFNPDNDEDGLFVNPYKIVNSSFVLTKTDKQSGEKTDTVISNFTAKILRDVQGDDGAEVTRFYDIEASLATGQRKRVTVAADRFQRMDWVSAELGSNAMMSAGAQIRDHVRAAIQYHSTAEEETVYGHTGWRQIDGRWLYLHGGGAVGEGGDEAAVRTDLQHLAAGGYTLPESIDPETDEGRQLIRDTLKKFSGAAKPHVSVPLFSTFWLAPIASFLPLSFVLYHAGYTGTGKTSVTALVQQGFGPRMNGKRLPAGWFDTANSLEIKSFLAKDAPLLIDDFVPRGSKEDIARANANFARICQNVGNQQSRGRARQDGSLRPERRPQGLVITTGEDTVNAQSAMARTIVIDVIKGDVDFGGGLDAAQEAANNGVFAQCVGGYLRWLARRLNTEGDKAIGKQLESWFRFFRKSLAASVDQSTHLRTPENLAFLATGLSLFLRFAQDVGAISPIEGLEQWSEWWKVLVKLCRSQGENLSQTDPVGQFFTTLRSAMLSGHAHLGAQEGGGSAPGIPAGFSRQSFGWRAGSGMYSTDQRLGDCVGWYDRDRQLIYLSPEAALRVVNKVGSMPFPWTKTTLAKRLKERGLLTQTCPHRNTLSIKRTCEGSEQAVLSLALDTVMHDPSDVVAVAVPPVSPPSDGVALQEAEPSLPEDVLDSIDWEEIVSRHADDRVEFEERVAIVQVDGRIPPDLAKVQVARELKWLN